MVSEARTKALDDTGDERTYAVADRQDILRFHTVRDLRASSNMESSRQQDGNYGYYQQRGVELRDACVTHPCSRATIQPTGSGVVVGGGHGVGAVNVSNLITAPMGAQAGKERQKD